MPIKILLVEDGPEYLEFYKKALAGHPLHIFEAGEVALAEKILLQHPDISAVVVDGRLEDTDFIQDTCEFVSRVRASGFSGHMIAASSNDDWRRSLVHAGCNHDGGDKKEIPRKLLEVLGL
jgi:response regulator RpfG family c-di-GMP phosphodiesterase